MQLKLISAQPATQYYAWQVEVYLTQFIRLGYNPEDIIVLGGYTSSSGVDKSWTVLKQVFPDVEIHVYEYHDLSHWRAMMYGIYQQRQI
jgi:hypothetical protein